MGRIFKIGLAAMALLAGIVAAAQSPVMIHSHNDYRQTAPFWQAYSQHVHSIEADVFLEGGVLLVGHDREDLSKNMTFKALYVEPIVSVFSRNGGKAWNDSDGHLQLMVEIKSKTVPALKAVTSLLSEYPEVFDPAVNENAVRVVVTGNVPAPEDFGRWPEYISFDGNPDTEYTAGQLERVALFSADFSNYSQWNGKGSVIPAEKDRLEEVISASHDMGKPVRFWNAPEGVTVYYTFYDMGIDYVNTDHPEACAAFFSDFGNKNFRIGAGSSMSEGVTGTKKLDKTTRDFAGFQNEKLQLSHGIDIYVPTYSSDRKDTEIKNVIFLIGDGMGLNQITAGVYANKGLSLMGVRNIGFQINLAKDAFTTDSAAGGSALATGERHDNRHISMSDDGVAWPSLTDWFNDMDKALGVVSLGNIADATPAAFYAHNVERDSADAITRSLLDGKLDLLCGSGLDLFTDRHDGVDIIGELSEEYTFITDTDDINAGDGKVICIDDAMGDAAEEANLTLLADVTKASISQLRRQGKDGFFLMVEGAKIDYAGHSRCLPGSVIEMLSFDMAVAEALKFADEDGHTLVVVTADHETGGLMLLDGDEETGRIMGVYVTDDHTPSMIPVFAYGPHADRFCGVYRNVRVPQLIRELTE